MFCLTTAMAGVELMLDGGSLEAAVITGSFNKINQINSFEITNIPGGGYAKA